MALIYHGSPVSVADGDTFLSLAERFRDDYAAPIILAKVGQRLVELNKTVPGEEALRRAGLVSPELSFITTADQDGHKTYERGATMMLLRALTRVFGKRIAFLKLEYSISDSLYFSLRLKDAPDGLTEEELAAVRATMERYVRENEKFRKERLSTEEVVALFRRYGMTDKERLFSYRRSSTTNIYRLGNYVDYYYGYMPPSAGYVDVFDLRKTDGGILMTLPNRARPTLPGNPAVAKKLFTVMRRTNTWGEHMGISTVADLNAAICRGEGLNIILASEAYQEHVIGEFAREIRDKKRRIVMIAGPSSSGKTSFSHRLSIQLANVGLRAHPIACDNYYVERTRTPRDENGEYDFECLEAMDLELFNRQMTALLRGERVELPTFNFKTGLPEYNGNSLSIRDGDVLVIEGIHGLNDRMSYAIAPEDKFKIYINALTTLNIDEHNRIAVTDNREIRRMVRDARTRGYPARETIARWGSVRHGEGKHIFPYQEDTDVMFNSASLYELAVLKTFAEPLLFAIPPDAPEYPEAKRLLKFLEYFLGLSPEDVPRYSLLREFIGGSVFPVG
ncbi:MAG: nucleoside kinase [Clostridia bacterium]|nr:nucleoside kinase [Clostridia bacterium]